MTLAWFVTSPWIDNIISYDETDLTEIIYVGVG